MTVPSEQFEKDNMRFYELFCNFHPENDLRSEEGIITGFANVLKTYFPNYHEKTLRLVSYTFTIIRLREINHSIFRKKLAQGADRNHPYSTRGKIQIARFTSNN